MLRTTRSTSRRYRRSQHAFECTVGLDRSGSNVDLTSSGTQSRATLGGRSLFRVMGALSLSVRHRISPRGKSGCTSGNRTVGTNAEVASKARRKAISVGGLFPCPSMELCSQSVLQKTLVRLDMFGCTAGTRRVGTSAGVTSTAKMIMGITDAPFPFPPTERLLLWVDIMVVIKVMG